MFNLVEIEMRARIVKLGKGLAVRIPKRIVRQSGWKEGDIVAIEVGSEGQIQLRRGSRIPSLAELVSHITPESRYGEISTRAGIGKEKVLSQFGL